jgi:hypothetical protein
MIVGNLYFIKNTNGLFYYGSDYLRDLHDIVREILVCQTLEAATRRMFPGITVVSCANAIALFWRVSAASDRGDIIYTPTSHPLPFIDRQWIVVHDAYPFLSRKGRLKHFLLILSLALSRCRVAYINESETLAFVRRLGVENSRLVFAPNKVELSANAPRPARKVEIPLKVGLVGTDSAKKRYEDLLTAVTAAGLISSINFRMYGHRTTYLEQVMTRHPEAPILLQESDRLSLDEFLDGIDVLVSVAELEGFGRPISVAMIRGVPCYLLRKPVFLEFFDGAYFFDDVDALVGGLRGAIAYGIPAQIPYKPPTRVTLGYRHAARQLRASALNHNN